MSYPKLYTLVQRVSAVTKTGMRLWRETEADEVFQLSFTEYSIRVRKGESRSSQGMPEYFLSILNAVGDVVEEIGDEDGENPDVKAGLYQEMKEIFETARRQAMGVDQALDSILNELDALDDDRPF